MKNYEIAQKLLKVKEPLTFNVLTKYYQNKIKSREVSIELQKIQKEINEYELIDWSVLASKEINYDAREEQCNKLIFFYINNKPAVIENYNFSSLIFDFKHDWNNYSKLILEEQKVLFYTKIAKYKAYLEKNKDNKSITANEFSSFYKYLININDIVDKEKVVYQKKELANYDEIVTLIMLKKK